MSWLLAFSWTLALELPIYTLLLGKRVASWQRLVLLVIAINAITHPLLWFAMPRLEPWLAYFAIGEIAVVVVEAAIVRAVIGDSRRAILASVAANATSATLGLVVMPLVLG